MEPNEKVVLLLEPAEQHPEFAKPLISLSKLILGEDSDRMASIAFPLPVSATHKGSRYDGFLSVERHVTVNGVWYATPSAAGRALLGYEVNGWRWWQFHDPSSGKSLPIDALRKRGLI